MNFKNILLIALSFVIYVSCKKDTTESTNSNISITITQNGSDRNIEVPASAVLANDTLTFIGLSTTKDNGFIISSFKFGQKNFKIDFLKNDSSHVQNIFILNNAIDTLTYFGYAGSFNISKLDLSNNKMNGTLISKALTFNIDSLAIDTIEARFTFSDFPILKK